MAEKTMERAFVDCQVERSPFSDERIFSTELPDGEDHIGAASYIYFIDRKGRKLKEDEPASGKSVRGAVEAIVIREEEAVCLVSLPDGSVASVPTTTALGL